VRCTEPSNVSAVSNLLLLSPLLYCDTPYARASKAALNIINKALLLDLKEQQVQCCCVHPGYVKTDMTGGLPKNYSRHEH
jgi:NAD(P)-dependent dehydrogenase (short-subunit alcohol dehydrogenase family)